ncbi:MAG: 2-oxoacid:acceptor oxidoreductase subunit alpha [Firmicutes bacterium]|nr:2-oxoacid:acceptor oxidoreductase subunit alpha [Bacillota bacterium]
MQNKAGIGTRTKLMQGNEACALGAIAAGVRFFAGYPITPSTEIAEDLSALLPRVGGKFIQMEDEIASISAVIGASLTGTKSLTATSGPGFSLKQESIGFAAIAEIPCVIVNVMRVGPSTGVPTAPSQADVMQARWGTHGDHPVVVLCPSSVAETYTLIIEAFNISEKWRIPVVFLMDEGIGHMREKIEIPNSDELKIIDRVRPVCNPNDYLPFDADKGDGTVPPMADFGTGYRYHLTGLTHDKTGFPTTQRPEVDALIRRLNSKMDKAKQEVTFIDEVLMDDADIVVFAYGISARAGARAVREARESGISAGLLKTKTLWPFPDEYVEEIASQVKAIIVPEMNMGQLVLEVERAVKGRTKVISLTRVDAEPISPDEILSALKGV